MDRIIGRNPVLEALRAGRGFDRLIVQKGAGGSIQKLLDEARARGVLIRFEDKPALDRAAGQGGHQGVVAFVSEFRYCEVGDILKAAADRGEAPFVAVLDSIEDPRNLGAILRAAEGAGVHGVIIPRRRAAGVNETVAKASAGAAEFMRIAQVANISRAVEDLKMAGVWAAALDMGGESYWGKDLTGAMALVVGGEGGGLGRLVKERCDFSVSIPMAGRVKSLNASSAAAILMYEIRRQREGAAPAPGAAAASQPGPPPPAADGAAGGRRPSVG
jgi:23S rRNA (guanosine2251-2'-O)-methyltransferase